MLRQSQKNTLAWWYVPVMALVAFLLAATASPALADTTITTNWTLQKDETVAGNLYLNAGTVNLNGHVLTVSGSLIQAGGVMDVHGGRLEVGGNYDLYRANASYPNTTGDGILKMVDAADYVLVGGSFTTRAYVDHSQHLTAGTLEIKGNFLQKTAVFYSHQYYSSYWTYIYTNFKASGTQRTVLSGNTLQTISFDNPSSSNFNILIITKPLATGYRFLCPTPVWNTLIEQASLSIDGISEGQRFNQPVTVSLTYANVTIDHILLKKNSGEPVEIPEEYLVNQDGVYELRVEAHDTLGNALVKNVAFSLDLTPPMAVIDDTAPFVVFNDGTKLTFDGSASSDANGISAYEWTFSDLESKLYGRVVERSFDTPGSCTASLVVTDSYGNRSLPDEVQIQVKEKGSTVITITGVEEGGRYNHDVAVAVTVADGELVKILLDGAAVGAASFVVDRDMPIPHVLYVEASNEYGYNQKKTVTFSMDKTKPVAACAATKTAYYTENTTFDASASTDLNGIVEYVWTFSDETQPRAGKIITRSFPAVGTVTGTLIVKDSFGNWSDPRAFTVSVVYRQVEIAIGGVQNGGKYNHDVTVNVTAGYGTIVSITDQDGTVHENGAVFTGNRVYTLTVVGANYGGERKTVTYEFTVDKEAPVAGIKSAGMLRGYNDGKPLTFDGTISTDNIGLSKYEWVISDNPAQKYYGTVIQHAFAVPGSYTATLTVIDTCGNVSAPATATVEIRDKGNTEITISGVQDGGRYNQDLNVIIAVSDGELTAATLDGEAVEPAGFTVADEQPNPHVLEVKAINQFEYETVKTVRFWLDKTPPVAAPGGDVTVYKDETVSFSASGSSDLNGIAAYRWIVPGHPDEIKICSFTHVFTAVGTYQVTLQVMDSCGNWSSPASRSVTVRYRPVEIKAEGLANQGKYNHDVTLNITAKYGTIESLTLNGAPISNGAVLTESMKYTLEIRARNEGNEPAPPVTYVFTIDKIKPTAVIKKDNLTGYNDGTPVVLDGTLSADNSGYLTYEWTFAGETTKYTGAVINRVFDTPGSYNVTLVTRDACGNSSEPDSATITIQDKGNAMIAISGVEENGKYNQNIQAAISVTGGTLKKILADGQLTASTSLSFTAEQIHEIYVEAVSDTGYVAKKTVRFSIDKTPPAADAGGVRNVVQDQVFTLTGRGTDRNPITAYKWTLSDGRQLEGNGVPCSFAGYGTYTVTLKVQDDHGNWSAPAAATVNVGYRPPEIKILGVTDGQKTSQDVAVNVEVKYGSLKGMLLNGSVYAPGTLITQEGYYYLDITVASQGNEEKTFKIHFAIDRTAPKANAGPDVAGWNDGIPVVLSGLGSTDDLGVKSFAWTFSDSAEVFTASAVRRTFAEPGVYTATLVVTDMAGNISAPDTAVITIRDKGNTAIVFTGFSEGQRAVSDISVGVSVTGGTLRKLLVDGVEGGGEPVLVTTDGRHNVYAEAVNEQGYILKRISYFYIDKSLPVADAGGDKTCYNGQPVTFEGGFSYDPVGIGEYRWAFTDTDTAYDTSKVTRVFDVPGEYLAQLWVKDTFGNWCAAPGTAKITVKDRGLLAVVTVRVTDETGGSLPGSIVVLEDGGERQSRYVTDQTGTVTVTVEEGAYKLYGYHSGYKSAVEELSLRTSETRQVVLKLVKGADIQVTAVAKQLDLQEIQALGIDTTAPENRWVFKFEATIEYLGVPYPLSICLNSLNEVVKEENNSPFQAQPLDRPGGDGAPEILIPASIIIEGTASVLKEFYDFTVFVLNFADESVALDDLNLHLNLPQGLSLAAIPLEHQNAEGDTIRWQNVDVAVGSVPGQSQKKIIWTLRGDQPGSYRPSVDYRGVLNPFQAKVEGRAELDSPIVITDPKVLHVHVEAPPWVVMGEKASLTVSLVNTGDKPFYDAYLQVDDLRLDKFLLACDLASLKVTKDALNPGETISLSIDVIPQISGPCVSKDIKQIGGNVSFTAQVLPSAPLDVMAIPGDGVVRLLWMESPDAFCHRVKRRCEGETAYETVADFVFGNSYDDTTVINFRKYYYIIVPVDDLGAGEEGTPSKEIEAFPCGVTATPAAGAYDDPLDVTLSVQGQATIYYTTDGSTPSPAVSPVYTGPIRVNRTMVISAVVVKDGSTSAAFHHMYTIKNPLYGDFVAVPWIWRAPAGPSYLNTGNELRLSLPDDRTYDLNEQAHASFMRNAPSGNWSAETRIDLTAYTAGNSFAAGMLVAGQNNYYTWGFYQGSNLAVGRPGKPALVQYTLGSETVLLRIRREGRQYCFEYRLRETDPWIYVTSLHDEETPAELGLYACTWSQANAFSLTAQGFKVTPLPDLDQAWQFQSATPGPNYHILGPNSFSLLLPGDSAYNADAAPVLYREDLGDGDWTVRTQIELGSYEGNEFRAGLFVDFGPGESLFFGFAGTNLVFSRIGRDALQKTIGNTAPELYVRLSKQGAKYLLEYRTAAADWTTAGEILCHLPVNTIGITAETSVPAQVVLTVRGFTLERQLMGLNLEWVWESPPGPTCKFTASDSAVISVPGDKSYDDLGVAHAPKLARTDLGPADWTASSAVELIEYQPGLGFQSGLMVQTAGDGTFYWGFHGGAGLAVVKNDGSVAAIGANSDTRIYLAVVKTGDRIGFLYRGDPAEDWRTAYSLALSGAPVKVGAVTRTWQAAKIKTVFTGLMFERSLGAEWRWHIPAGGPAYIVHANGAASLTVPADRTYNHTTNTDDAPRCFRTDMGAQDWTFEGRISLLESSAASFRTGLMVSFGENDLVHWGLNGDDLLQFSRTAGGGGGAPYDGKTLYLRIAKTGNIYEFSYRATPQNQWATAGTMEITKPVTAVGFMTSTGQPCYVKTIFAEFSLVKRLPKHRLTLHLGNAVLGCRVSGAVLTIDGTTAIDVDAAALYDVRENLVVLELDEGAHALLVTAPGYEEYRTTVDLAADAEIHIGLNPLPGSGGGSVTGLKAVWDPASQQLKVSFSVVNLSTDARLWARVTLLGAGGETLCSLGQAFYLPTGGVFTAGDQTGWVFVGLGQVTTVRIEVFQGDDGGQPVYSQDMAVETGE
ncbi:MAG: PKD domain-containing protein [Patescibacteria group bacterium]